MSEEKDENGITWGRCPKCLKRRPGDPTGEFGLSFAGGCPHCDYRFIPEPEEQTYTIYVCPYCLKQVKPHVDHNLGTDMTARNCQHAHPGERGITPQLIKIGVVPAEPLEPREIPHDRPITRDQIMMEDEGEE